MVESARGPYLRRHRSHAYPRLGVDAHVTRVDRQRSHCARTAIRSETADAHPASRAQRKQQTKQARGNASFSPNVSRPYCCALVMRGRRRNEMKNLTTIVRGAVASMCLLAAATACSSGSSGTGNSPVPNTQFCGNDTQYQLANPRTGGTVAANSSATVEIVAQGNNLSKLQELRSVVHPGQQRWRFTAR